ncbi:site-specific integrase [Pseudomonas sp. BN414]|uniref:hypothetical protein n=1 Tax=Pseudomonas sp. BN414 TaxID=2567888 RepID=UPI00245602F9|nr:hypothetical protein [Pseudomonas sp. BN414]MDH4567970.1 site-specific integrase [Pseudomonas sp. BN414]
MNELINFRLEPRIHRGHDCHSLIWKSGAYKGEEYPVFTVFSNNLIKEMYPNNTRKFYELQGAQFLDYVEVGCQVKGSRSAEAIALLCDDYYDYLTWGEKAYSYDTREIFRIKPRNIVTPKSASQYHAPVKKLILCSSKHIQTLESQQRVYGASRNIQESIQDLAIYKTLQIDLKSKEKAALERNSGISAVLSGGPKRRQANLLTHVPTNFGDEDEPLDKHKFFPFQYICELIQNAPTYREATLWSLCAATGIRESEGDELLVEDAKPETGKVFIIEPTSRKNFSSAYSGITQQQFNKLEYKGRAIPHTLMLEPYGTMFWYNLDKYWKAEYNPCIDHNFLFQASDGSPLYLQNYGSAVLQPFQKVAERILPPVYFQQIRKLGLHSLRHSYCYYFKNFFKHTHGYGLTDHELMMLTGHTSERSVRKYGAIDRERLEEKLTIGMNFYDFDSIKSLQEFRIGFHEDRIAELRREIAEYLEKQDEQPEQMRV